MLLVDNMLLHCCGEQLPPRIAIGVNTVLIGDHVAGLVVVVAVDANENRAALPGGGADDDLSRY